MSKKQKIQQKKALNSDLLAQRIAELRLMARKPPVRTSQTHVNKKKCTKLRRREGI